MPQFDLRRLSGEQLKLVLEAAQTLRPASREEFLQSVEPMMMCPADSIGNHNGGRGSKTGEGDLA
jgi:hypothetical protein